MQTNPTLHIQRWTTAVLLLLAPLTTLLGQTDCCEEGDKITALTLTYTGEGCVLNHQQDSDKVACYGDVQATATVHIVASDKPNPNNGKIWFDGLVQLGQDFTLSASLANANKLKSNTWIHIFDTNGNWLQSIKFHTSCSQPLAVGNQFGSVIVKAISFKNGYSCFIPETCPTPQLSSTDGNPLPDTLCIEETITLQAEDIGLPCVEYLWDIDGDGQTDTTGIGPIEITFAQSGYYEVQLRITNNSPEGDSSSGNICINNGDDDDGDDDDGDDDDGDDDDGDDDDGDDDDGDDDDGDDGDGDDDDGDDDDGDDGDGDDGDGDDEPINCCQDGAKPAQLTLSYTGLGCTMDHQQDPSKVECIGDALNTSSVYIIANDKSSPNAGKTWFAGWVNLGENFTIDAAQAGKNKLSSNTYIHLYDADGNFLQLIKFHTSCSQPLAIGNQFGSITIEGITFKDGSSCMPNDANDDAPPLTCIPCEVTTSWHVTAIACGPQGRIGDFVWRDDNGNGIQDVDEAGVASVEVRLEDCAGNVLAATFTDSEGFYQFDQLTSGNYRIHFILPAMYSFTTPYQGDSTLDSDADAEGRSACISLSANESRLDIDAGLIPQTSPCTLEVAIDHVVCDDQATPDNPMDDTWTFQMTVSGTGTSNQWTAELAGQTISGTYGTSTSMGPFLISAGTLNFNIYDSDQPSCGLNQAVLPPAPCSSAAQSGIGDRVWLDQNGNGIQEEGEPGLEGIFVLLYDCNGNYLNDFQVSDAAGFYFFPNLPPGNYQIKMAHPGGQLFVSPKDAGIDDAKDSDLNANTYTDCITLMPNELNLTIDGGFAPMQARCSLQAMASNVMCHDNGTPNDETDDQYFFDLLVTGENTGTNGWRTDNYALFGQYGTTTTAGPYAIVGGDVTLTLVDVDDPSCQTTITVQKPLPCSTGDCDNFTAGGLIGYDESRCGPYDPELIVNIELPSGGSGAIEYIWLASTEGCPDNLAYHIPNSNAPEYDPGLITQTTWFRRCARREGCEIFTGETNCVVKEVLPGCAGGSASVGDYVWVDANGNGIQEANESPLSGVYIFLQDANGNDIPGAMTISDANGYYLFDNLGAGTYRIRFANPGGYWPTTPDVGPDDQIDSDIDYLGQTAFFTLDGTNTRSDIDAGWVPDGSSQMQNNFSNDITTNIPQGLQPIAPSNSEVSAPIDIVIFPNPTSGMVYVRTGQFAKQTAQIVLLNALGQRVRQYGWWQLPEGVLKLPLHDLPEGQYFLQLATENLPPQLYKLIITPSH